MSSTTNYFLRRSALCHIHRHPWLMFFSVLGVALGVAVVVAIDLVTHSAKRSFAQANEMVSGHTTHQIIAGPAGLDESIYLRLRLELGMRHSAPVLEGQAVIESPNETTFTLLGVDPLADPTIRRYQSDLPGEEFLSRLLTIPNAVMMAEATAQELDIAIDDEFSVRIDGVEHSLRLVGQLKPNDPVMANAMRHLLLTDIATSQALLNRVGRLTRIDLVLDEVDQAKQLNQINDWLPTGVQLINRKGADNAQAQMTEAFEINLQAMSLLALLVGAFIVFNTMTFSMLQRRQLFGLLRALGVSSGEIWRVALLEVMLIGVIGLVIGIGLGVVLADNLLNLVTRAINDLYYSLQVNELVLSYGSILKGTLLGIGVTLLVSAIPIREATNTPPRATLSRSFLEQKSRHWIQRLALLGVIGMIVGLVMIVFPSRSLSMTFLGLFLLVIAYAMTIPYLSDKCIQSISAVWPKGKLLLIHMAITGVRKSLSRTGIAMAALMVAISTIVGVSIMIHSFRGSVIDWIEQTLQGDVYVSMLEQRAAQARGIPPQLITDVRAMSEVQAVTIGRYAKVPVGEQVQEIFALDLHRDAFDGFQILEYVGEPWQAFQNENAVLVSEPYAYRHQLTPGQQISLPTAEGQYTFIVVGIYRDYSTEYGRIAMRRSLYERLWHDPIITTMGIYLYDQSDVDEVLNKVGNMLPNELALRLRSNLDIRRATVEIFDRTFVITDVLRLLTLLVAVVGILAALMALQMERVREFAVLRVTGMTPQQLWRLVTTETTIMGLLAGLFALPLGLALAVSLIQVVNFRAFGWSMSMSVDAMQLVSTLLISLVAAVLAGAYPAFRMTRTSPALALREE